MLSVGPTLWSTGDRDVVFPRPGSAMLLAMCFGSLPTCLELGVCGPQGHVVMFPHPGIAWLVVWPCYVDSTFSH